MKSPGISKPPNGRPNISILNVDMNVGINREIMVQWRAREESYTDLEAGRTNEDWVTCCGVM